MPNYNPFSTIGSIPKTNYNFNNITVPNFSNRVQQTTTPSVAQTVVTKPTPAPIATPTPTPPPAPPKPYSKFSKLAGMVRAKYPGDYDDLSDDDLGQKVLDKYPEYYDLVDKDKPFTDSLWDAAKATGRNLMGFAESSPLMESKRAINDLALAKKDPEAYAKKNEEQKAEVQEAFKHPVKLFARNISPDITDLYDLGKATFGDISSGNYAEAAGKVGALAVPLALGYGYHKLTGGGTPKAVTPEAEAAARATKAATVAANDPIAQAMAQQQAAQAAAPPAPIISKKPKATPKPKATVTIQDPVTGELIEVPRPKGRPKAAAQPVTQPVTQSTAAPQIAQPVTPPVVDTSVVPAGAVAELPKVEPPAPVTPEGKFKTGDKVAVSYKGETLPGTVSGRTANGSYLVRTETGKTVVYPEKSIAVLEVSTEAAPTTQPVAEQPKPVVEKPKPVQQPKPKAKKLIDEEEDLRLPPTREPSPEEVAKAKAEKFAVEARAKYPGADFSDDFKATHPELVNSFDYISGTRGNEVFVKLKDGNGFLVSRDSVKGLEGLPKSAPKPVTAFPKLEDVKPIETGPKVDTSVVPANAIPEGPKPNPLERLKAERAATKITEPIPGSAEWKQRYGDLTAEQVSQRRAQGLSLLGQVLDSDEAPTATSVSKLANELPKVDTNVVPEGTVKELKVEPVEPVKTAEPAKTSSDRATGIADKIKQVSDQPPSSGRELRLDKLMDESEDLVSAIDNPDEAAAAHKTFSERIKASANEAEVELLSSLKSDLEKKFKNLKSEPTPSTLPEVDTSVVQEAKPLPPVEPIPETKPVPAVEPIVEAAAKVSKEKKSAVAEATKAASKEKAKPATKNQDIYTRDHDKLVTAFEKSVKKFGEYDVTAQKAHGDMFQLLDKDRPDWVDKAGNEISINDAVEQGKNIFDSEGREINPKTGNPVKFNKVAPEQVAIQAKAKAEAIKASTEKRKAAAAAKKQAELDAARAKAQERLAKEEAAKKATETEKPQGKDNPDYKKETAELFSRYLADDEIDLVGEQKKINEKYGVTEEEISGVRGALKTAEDKLKALVGTGDETGGVSIDLLTGGLLKKKQKPTGPPIPPQPKGTKTPPVMPVDEAARKGLFAKWRDKARYGKFMEANPRLKEIADTFIKSRSADKVTRQRIAQEFEHINNLSAKDMVQFEADVNAGKYPEVRKFFDDLHDRLTKEGIEVDYKKGFLPQRWKETVRQIRDYNKRINKTASFQQRSKFLSYAEGVNNKFTPADAPLKLLQDYAVRADKLIADTKFLSDMKKAGYLTRSRKAPYNYQTLNKDLVPSARNKNYATLKAHPRIKEVVESYLTDNSNSLGSIAAKASGKVANVMMTSGLIPHLPGTTARGFTIARPLSGTAWREGGFKRMVQGLDAGYVPGGASRRYKQYESEINMREWAAKEHGWNENVLDTGGGEPIFEGTDGLMGPFKKGINKAGELQQRFFETPYKKMASFLKWESWKDAYKSAVKDGKMSNKEAGEYATRISNNAYSGENLDLLYNNKAYNNTMKNTFLSSNWMKSSFESGKDMLKAIDPRSTMPAFQRQKNFKMMGRLMATYTVANLLQKAITGKYMVENDPGHKFDLQIGQDSKGKPRNIKLWAGSNDALELGTDVVDSTIGMVKGNPKASPFADTMDFMSHRLNIPGGVLTSALQGEDYQGRPNVFSRAGDYGQPTAWGGKHGKLANTFGQAVNYGPAWLSAPYNYGMDRASLEEAIARAGEMQISYGRPKKNPFRPPSAEDKEKKEVYKIQNKFKR